MDETTVPVLDPGRGRTKTGYPHRCLLTSALSGLDRAACWRAMGSGPRRSRLERQRSARHCLPLCAGSQRQACRASHPRLRRHPPGPRRRLLTPAASQMGLPGLLAGKGYGGYNRLTKAERLARVCGVWKAAWKSGLISAPYGWPGIGVCLRVFGLGRRQATSRIVLGVEISSFFRTSRASGPILPA